MDFLVIQLDLSFSIIRDYTIDKEWAGAGTKRQLFFIFLALNITQMDMDIQKEPEVTIIIIPNNFYLNNITKKLIPGTPLGKCPTSGCPRL